MGFSIIGIGDRFIDSLHEKEFSMKTRSPQIYRLLPETAFQWVDRWKDFSPHTIAIMLKSSAMFLCLALVLELTFSITPDGWVQHFDENILNWVGGLRTPFLNMMMVDVTALGGLALTIVLGLLTSAIFLLARDPAAAIHLVLTATGGFFISIYTKGLIARPRPTVIPQLIQASGFSYPSGHSITSSAIYLTMAILACRHFQSLKSRIFLLTLAAIMIALISFSRIYLGVHYPSDTMSGALMGMAWALFMATLFAKTHFAQKK
jgi:undecaprenyl-diphosphatase